MKWVVHGVLAAAAVLALPQAPKRETWTEWLLRVTGLSATPRNTGGEKESLVAGDIWVLNLSGEPSANVAGGRYRSPVFAPRGGYYALRSEELVRIESSGTKKACDAKGVQRLMAFESSDPNRLILLKDYPPTLGSLDLKTCQFYPAPVELPPPDANRLLGWNSEINNVAVWHQRITPGGPLVIRLKRGAQIETYESGDEDWAQPALSSSATAVVYIRSKRN